MPGVFYAFAGTKFYGLVKFSSCTILRSCLVFEKTEVCTYTIKIKIYRAHSTQKVQKP